MTDPKNVPLAEARPGDIVYLKPQHVFWVCPNATHVTADSKYGRVPLEADWIDHIERPPRVLKVGDRARYRNGGSKVIIRAIHALFNGRSRAWVEFANAGDNFASPLLTDLEPVE